MSQAHAVCKSGGCGGINVGLEETGEQVLCAIFGVEVSSSRCHVVSYTSVTPETPSIQERTEALEEPAG